MSSSPAELLAYLAACDADYSPVTGMTGGPMHGPGYHTTLAEGTWVHSTRSNLDYALGLLAAGRAERAGSVIERVLALQDRDPASRTYGIWPWFLEESLAQMSPPDWNWADFCGARLLVAMRVYAALLPEALQVHIREALRHASESIIRRNVGPGYTNIAIMGGGVTAATGELLGDARLLDYGRTRLEGFVAHTQDNGSFAEYNSPTYTIVVIEEVERILHLVQDPAVRAAAEWIRRHAWELIAEHFHPATQQWAGPHSRTYSDRLSTNRVHYLSERLGFALRAHPDLQGSPKGDFVPELPALPCPPDLAERFRRLPADPLVVRRRFARKESEAESVWGTTWLSTQACLASVNHDLMWNQRRPVLGYWQTPADPAVVLRLRFLLDGRDFSSAHVENTQDGPAIRSRLTLVPGWGSFHLHLDKPADGIFPAEDLRVRYELQGHGVTARREGEGRYVLAAGNWEARIGLGPAHFQGAPLAWELGEADGRVFLDGVCYRGPRRAFAFPELGNAEIRLDLDLRRV